MKKVVRATLIALLAGGFGFTVHLGWSAGQHRSDSLVRLLGRWDRTDPNRPRASWSGATAIARFEGTEVSVQLNASGPEFRYVALIDGGSPIRFAAQQGTAIYLLARDLATGLHEIRVSTESEGQHGTTQFLGFDFGRGKALPPPRPAVLQMESIGDSLTCGYGILGAQEFAHAGNGWNPRTCQPTLQNQSHYMAFSTVLARMLGAELTTVCVSGRGVWSDWQGNVDSERDPQMPSYYKDTLTAGNGVRLHEFPFPASGARPNPADLVLINLGTNDIAGATHAHGNQGTLPEFNAWQKAYLALIAQARAYHPDALIFLTLGPVVDEPLLSGYRKYLSRLIRESRDPRLHQLTAVPQDPSAGLGCAWHPTALPIQLGTEVWRGGENEHFASQLATQIRKYMNVPGALDRDPNPLDPETREVSRGSYVPPRAAR
jgi:hypothetical protein